MDLKLFVHNAQENWIIDRLSSEWKSKNLDICVNSVEDSNVIWMLSPWIWREIPIVYLESKTIVLTIHHIVPEKFNENEFKERDRYIDYYHVTNRVTADFLRTQTDKPIQILPFWVNPNLWFELDKKKCREEIGLPLDKCLIGSFQRDTEGHDLITPKLEKGPDVFCDMVENAFEDNKDIEVVLGGWRRQYIMNRLQNAGIKYHYFELPPIDFINKLYNALDLYIVGARVEGGPQSIVECALTKTPIISTNVGIADLILSEKSLYTPNKSTEVIPNVDIAYDNVQKYCIDNWVVKYREYFERLK